MSIWTETVKPSDAAANAAQAQAVGCCLMLLAILVFFWMALTGVKTLLDRRHDRRIAALYATYPDPVCEMCGEVLDGTHPGCVPTNREPLNRETPQTFPSFGNGPGSSGAGAKVIPGMPAPARGDARGRGVASTAPTVARAAP